LEKLIPARPDKRGESMKKVLYIAMMLAIAVALSACDTQQPERVETTQEQSKQEKAQKVDENNLAKAQFLAKSDAQAYYRAAESGDYVYTYSNLTSVDKDSFTRDEWVKANQVLQSDLATYTINSVRMKDAATADVYLTIAGSDGSVSQRHTQFVLEGGGTYKHHLTTEEYTMFSDALASGSSSASASATAGAPAGGGTEPATASASASPSAPAGGGGGGGGKRYDSVDNLNCDDVSAPFKTPPGDPDNLDADGDGTACETE
jgi:hypothetical protein